MKTINVTDNQISELIDMLSKLNKKNLYLYWLVFEKQDEFLTTQTKKDIDQILEHYRSQISRMYMLNIVEQNIVNHKNTQLNQVLLRLKDKLNSGKIMDEFIVNGLCLSNLDTIFNKDDVYKLEFSLCLTRDINNAYLIDGINYANSFCSKQKMKKKIPNKV